MDSLDRNRLAVVDGLSKAIEGSVVLPAEERGWRASAGRPRVEDGGFVVVGAQGGLAREGIGYPGRGPGGETEGPGKGNGRARG
jgi:hypothetical protein